MLKSPYGEFTREMPLTSKEYASFCQLSDATFGTYLGEYVFFCMLLWSEAM